MLSSIGSRVTARWIATQATRQWPKPALLQAPFGGIPFIESLLRTREAYSDCFWESRPVFVSIDVDWSFAKDYQGACPVRQIAFATLDSWKLKGLRTPGTTNLWIQPHLFRDNSIETTKQWKRTQTAVDDQGWLKSDRSPQPFTQEELPDIIRRVLRIPANTRDTAFNANRCDTRLRTVEDDGEILRKVVIVGHGLGNDLQFLERAGVNVMAMPFVHGQIDTHFVSNHLFPTSKRGHTLEGLLRRLGCPIPTKFFSHALYDAVLPVYAMVLMGIEAGTRSLFRSHGLSAKETAALEACKESMASHLGAIDPGLSNSYLSHLSGLKLTAPNDSIAYKPFTPNGGTTAATSTKTTVIHHHHHYHYYESGPNSTRKTTTISDQSSPAAVAAAASAVAAVAAAAAATTTTNPNASVSNKIHKKQTISAQDLIKQALPLTRLERKRTPHR